MIQQLARLVEVSVTLNSTLDPDQLLHFIIEKAAELLDCEAASIMLYDEKRDQLYFTAATGTDSEKLVEIPVPLEGSIAGTIFRENKPLVINEVEKDPRHYNQVGEQVKFQPHSLLGVPMRIRDKTTGVLEALNKRKGDFTDMDVRMLSVIASQAAVAIHNANLVQALQHAYDELSRIDKIKSDFIAIASHELRTPLGVILGYATFLQEEAQGEMSEHASAVLNSALRLRSLVEAMTNMNMLRLGSVKLDMQPVILQKAIQCALEEVSLAFESKRQSVALSMPGTSLVVSGDEEKLRLVFVNLLDNAMRFSPEDSRITIRTQVVKDEAKVEIQDEGIGIPPSELENIFKEFYQVEDHMTRRYGGLGLGLAIARSVVELHRGHIWAESDGPGKGSMFVVVFPNQSG